jgi:hypothetical protein
MFQLVFKPMMNEEPADSSKLHAFFDWLKYVVLRVTSR